MARFRTRPSPGFNRRDFVKSAGLGLGAALLETTGALGTEPIANPKTPAAIIGHTGQGNYGHGLDLIFNDRDNIQVVAVADPVASGRGTAAQASRALRQYDDYRVMLETEKPKLISVAPRWTDRRLPMAMAAFQAGAHVYIEKPIARDLMEADQILDAADRAGLKVAVAHQMRLAPSILHLKRSIEQGAIGDLQGIRAYGKQDARSGGEDMLVLGTHLFDLMRLFAGEALWCTARVLQDGRDITRADARPATENIGPVAGNEIEAQFAFPNGVQATFTSRPKLRSIIGHWGMELIGSKATARVLADIFPTVYLLPPGEWSASGKTERWASLEGDPGPAATPAERGFVPANRRVVDDWLEAIQKNREPICSGRAATKALEMVMGVYEAALSGRRAAFPLPARTHPLA